AGFWRADVPEHEAAAVFWWLRNRCYFRHDMAEHPEHVRLVRYETLVRDPVARFRELFEWIGVPFDPAFVDGVSDRSVGKGSEVAVGPEVAALCDTLQLELAARS